LERDQLHSDLRRPSRAVRLHTFLLVWAVALAGCSSSGGSIAALGLSGRLEGLGKRIEQLYPGLRPGEGAALLMNSYALIIGLWQQADVPLSLRSVMHLPEMRIFKIDFERQLSAALLDLWDAAARRGA